MYWVRIVGGLLYVSGVVMLGINFLMTWRNRPAQYTETVHEAPGLGRLYTDLPKAKSRFDYTVAKIGHKIDIFMQAIWHRRWERLPLLFTVWTIIAVVVASLFEIVPTFLIRSNVPSISSVKPYTPLELAGRDIYIAEGCYNCHSQMIRPIWSETKRYGEYSKPGEFVYDHPFQWGSRRIGPDLAREGGKQSHDWHVRHFENPRQLIPQSIMPAYAHLLNQALDFDGIQSRVNAMAMLGVPYGEAVTPGRAAQMAREQAATIAQTLEAQGGYSGLNDKKIIALVAYMQRLGTDIHAPPAAPPADETQVGSAADQASVKEVVP
jgi:cytochrome c oxidase cbb3-type subunit I/II